MQNVEEPSEDRLVHWDVHCCSSCWAAGIAIHPVGLEPNLTFGGYIFQCLACFRVQHVEICHISLENLKSGE